MIVSAYQDWDLFSGDDVMINNDIDPDMSNDLFADDLESNIADDSSLNVNGVPSDLTFPTENLATDSSSDCSPSSPLNRNRARSDFCAETPSDQPSDLPLRYLEVFTAEDVNKYWCSLIVPDVIPMIIPVCLTPPGWESPWEGLAAVRDFLEQPDTAKPLSGILNAFRCKLSKSTLDAGIEKNGVAED